MTVPTSRPAPGAGERDPGPGQGDLPRWPGAPEHRPNQPTFFECSSCGGDSTLTYRCSECGYDPLGGER